MVASLIVVDDLMTQFRHIAAQIDPRQLTPSDQQMLLNLVRESMTNGPSGPRLSP